MDAAHSLACHQKIRDHLGKAVSADLQAAVLIVERRINQNRLFSHVDAIIQEHPQHSRDPFFDGSLSMEHLDQRRIQPDAPAGGRLHAFSSLGALPDDGSRSHIPRLQRMHESLAVHIDQHGTHRADLFRHQRPENLRRIGGSGGMVLDRILVKKGRARPVTHHQAVRRGSVMVGGGEVLIVKPSRTAGGDDNRLRPCHLVLACLHVLEHGSRHLALVVFDQLHGRCEIHHRNLPVPDLVPQHPHDLRPGVILAGVHPLPGGAAAVGGDHPAVLILVKHDAQIVQPLDSVRRLHHQAAQKLRPGREMSASEGVQVMALGGVVLLICRLDAAFRHHGVGVADPELCHHHHIGPGRMCLYRCRGSRSSSADHQHVHVIIHLI